MDTANRRANQKQSPPGAAGADGARPGGSASITHTDLKNFDRWSLDRIEAKAVREGLECVLPVLPHAIA